LHVFQRARRSNGAHRRKDDDIIDNWGVENIYFRAITAVYAFDSLHNLHSKIVM
jgi:hypothetical protein